MMLHVLQSQDNSFRLTSLQKERQLRTLCWAKFQQMPEEQLIESLHFARLANAGISCVPIPTDGSRKPPIKWRDFCDRIPSKKEYLNWYKEFGNVGVAAISGAVSGGLEVLDFDDGNLLIPWLRLVEPIAIRLPIVSTPSFGYHVFYRCEVVCGNQKIAVDPSREKQTLIETRGEHGFVVAVGSPAACHPSGRIYVQEYGPLFPDQIPQITPDERRQLWEAARTFDRRPKYQDEIENRLKELRRKSQPVRPIYSATDLPPWVDFDDRGCWSEILRPAGWTSYDGIHWYRPGKTSGSFSANVNIATNTQQEVLTVFSSNAGPLSPSNGDISWGKSDAYRMLHHGGDKRESARALRRMGYGGRK